MPGQQQMSVKRTYSQIHYLHTQQKTQEGKLTLQKRHRLLDLSPPLLRVTCEFSQLTPTNRNSPRERMGKKQKRGSKQSIVPHREAFMRMNFLFQVKSVLELECITRDKRHFHLFCRRPWPCSRRTLPIRSYRGSTSTP